ncbi:hypothetical protein PG984_011564 [Apiospora sp. TS-2023a]
MVDFAKFPEFPCELRLMIWARAAENEASNRLVFIHRGTLRPMPIKCLVSPLLLVSEESREVALKHYDLRLDVLRLPAMGRGGEGEGGSRQHTSQSWTDKYRTFCKGGASLADQVWLLRDGLEVIGTAKGALYLSPDQDRFMPFSAWPAGYVHNYMSSCSHPFNLEEPPTALPRRCTCANKPEYNYTSVKLPPSDCERVSRVVHCYDPCPTTNNDTWYFIGQHPRVCPKMRWMLERFDRMKDPSSKRLILDATKLSSSQDHYICNIVPSLIQNVSRRGAAIWTWLSGR